MNNASFKCFLLLSFLLFITSVCFAEEFPYRKNYPDVPIIDLEDVRTSFEKDELIFVDARTKMEFDTIHPKSAVNLDFSHQKFLDDLIQVGESNPGKKVVVYGNGVTCLKSYIAVQGATDEGMENIYAYDGGIEAWAESYPSDTLLMGHQIVDPKSQLIPTNELLKVTIDFDLFKQKIKESPRATVVDVRDPKQRTKKVPGLDKAMPIPLDKLIRNVISKGHMKDKQLFIFDQVGRQVGWLMYYLEKEGYRNYYFLKGGATAVLKDQKYR